jgi:hypothetical protein
MADNESVSNQGGEVLYSHSNNQQMEEEGKHGNKSGNKKEPEEKTFSKD